MTLTKAERAILKDLPGAVNKSFRSKPTLRLLGALAEKGVINFDPFMNSASLTDAGRAAISETTN